MSDANEIALEGLAPVLTCLIAVVMLSSICGYYKFYLLPSACISLIVGLIVGAVIFVADANNKYILPFTEFHSTFFTLALLPPVVFWSGYRVFRDDFYTELGSILCYAFIGTTVSSVFVGLVIWGSGVQNLSVTEALAFGSMISAVDPVGTLAIFGAVKADPKVEILIFGESILNDAVSIVLYNTFMTFNDQPFSGSLVGEAIGTFLLTMFGSAGIGLGIGCISALFTKYCKLHQDSIMEAISVFFFSLLAYFLAQGAGLSGIIASFSGGIFMGMYTDRNLSEAGRVATHGVLETAASVADMLIFFTIGTSVWSMPANYTPDSPFTISWDLGALTFGLILVGRALHIFPLTFLLNLNRVDKIPMNYQWLMFWSGLRGGIAYSLALEMKSNNQGAIIFATLFIVILTTLLFGCTTYPMLKQLKIECGLEQIEDNNWFSKHNTKRQFLLRLHINVLRPFFVKKEALEQKFLGRGSRVSNAPSYGEGLNNSKEEFKLVGFNDTQHVPRGGITDQVGNPNEHCIQITTIASHSNNPPQGLVSGVSIVDGHTSTLGITGNLHPNMDIAEQYSQEQEEKEKEEKLRQLFDNLNGDQGQQPKTGARASLVKYLRTPKTTPRASSSTKLQVPKGRNPRASTPGRLQNKIDTPPSERSTEPNNEQDQHDHYL